MRDANLRAMGHNVIHFKLSDTYDVKAFGSMMRGYGIPTTKPYADSRQAALIFSTTEPIIDPARSASISCGEIVPG